MAGIEKVGRFLNSFCLKHGSWNFIGKCSYRFLWEQNRDRKIKVSDSVKLSKYKSEHFSVGSDDSR